jgi:uncharacterized membrane protein
LQAEPRLGGFDPRGRTVPAANGWQWIVDGWKLFRRQFGMWIALVLGFLAVMVVLGLVPVAGGAAAALIAPVLSGGLMLACRTIDEGASPRIEQLFAGFRQNTQQLVVVGIFHLVAVTAIVLLLTIFVGANVGFGALVGGMVGHPGMGAMTAGVASMFLAALLGAALSVPVYAALWFAPALIVFHDLDAVAALKASFFAILKNIPATFLYSLILLALAVLAGVSFGLGYLVLAPVGVASVYASYRDIFLVR